VTPAGGRTRRRGRLSSSFVRGYRNRNPLVLLVAGVLCLAALLGLELAFTSGAWSDVPLGHWLRMPLDDFVYVSWAVGGAKDDPPDTPSIYILGGSSARESIVGDDSLERAIVAAGGPRTTVLDIGSNNQNFAQSIAVIDNVPDTPATAIVGINLNRFYASRADNEKQVVGRELLLDSPDLRDYVHDDTGHYRFSFTILPGIFSWATSYAKQHKEQLLSGELPNLTYKQHRYTKRRNHSVAEKEEMVQEWLTQRAPVYHRWLDYNTAMLEELLRVARARGVDVVLLELPLNLEIVGDAWDADLQAYRQRVRRLAREYGVPYVDFNPELHIPNTDFHDIDHLVEPGRVIWEDRLAEELAKLLAPQGRAGETKAAADGAAGAGGATTPAGGSATP
jgi:hypothetical protein